MKIHWNYSMKKRIKTKELSTVCKQISNMSMSGCDFLTIFDILINSSTDSMSKSLNIVKLNLKKGKNLSQSFACANVFSDFFINMVYAGEISGNVDLVFDRLSTYYSREYKLKSKLLNVMIYPIMIILVSIVSLNFMLIFVIPNFETIFDLDTMKIPVYTKILFKFSRFLRENTLLFYIFILVFTYIIANIFIKSSFLKNKFEEKIYTSMLTQNLMKTILVDKFSRTMSILIQSGIQIETSIQISSRVISNSYVNSKIAIILQSIKSGNNISISLRKCMLFPEIFLSMINSGEVSGNFEKSLHMAAQYYEEELDNRLDQLMKLIEPLMIVILGFLIGGVMFCILSPMLDIISNIS